MLEPRLPPVLLSEKGDVLMTSLPGEQHITYQLQYRKCGKPSCRICRSGPGHGPYWYAYWREGSRLCSAYIGKVRPASPAASRESSAPESTTETDSGEGLEEPPLGNGTP